MYRTSQEQMSDVLGIGMSLLMMTVVFGMLRSLLSDTLKSPELLPQTVLSPDGKEPTPHLTRKQVTETILGNLVQAGVLLPEETGRYRRVLGTYDDIALLRVLLHSHELRQLREE